ncbi:MAG: serine O-acetyltransferase [Acidimicrobiales bacterium]|jgi:serine O-acetyltransferase
MAGHNGPGEAEGVGHFVELHDLDHAFAETLVSQRHPLAPVLPSKHDVEDFVDEVVALFFPQRAADVVAPEDEVRARLTLLRADLSRVLCTVVPGERALDLAGRFSGLLPGVYEMLRADAAAIAAGDPAAESLEEVIAAYPGFIAITVHRLAHGLHGLGVPVLPRLLAEVAHARTGVDVHPGAQVGRSFCIDHGTGIVIGETAVIGDGVKIYQGVTLGALSVTKSAAGKKRHPTIEDGVVIYANATVLGGTTTVGRDSVIGGNVWLTTSVPPRSYVYHTSQVRVRSVADTLEPLDFSI